jgi:hypothetical protein
LGEDTTRHCWNLFEFILCQKRLLHWPIPIGSKTEDFEVKRATLQDDLLDQRSVRSLKRSTPRKSNGSSVHAAARKVLKKLLEPLARLAFDCGFSVNELHSMLREAAVRSAAEWQLQSERRINISGIAATTGISRGQISRILKYHEIGSDKASNGRQSPIGRILAGWHSDTRFLSANQLPAELDLYGRGFTFESLVRRYGRGIPVRAIFDELTRIGAVELTASRKILPKTSVAVNRRITPEVIEAFGSWATDLLSAKLRNTKSSYAPVSKVARLRVTMSADGRSKRRRNFRRID